MMPKEPKNKGKERATPGPKPDTLKIGGDWREAIKKSLGKKKPTKGWPK